MTTFRTLLWVNWLRIKRLRLPLLRMPSDLSLKDPLAYPQTKYCPVARALPYKPGQVVVGRRDYCVLNGVPNLKALPSFVQRFIWQVDSGNFR